MPRRYCGSLSIYLSILPDSISYRVRVAQGGRSLGEEIVRLAPAERRASDDPCVVDEVAASALSFLLHEGADLDRFADQGESDWTIRRTS